MKHGRSRKEVNDSMWQGQLEEDSKGKQVERRKILVVGRGDLFTEEAADYTVNLAERLDYDIFAVNIGRGSDAFSSSDSEMVWREGFRKRAEAAAKALRKKAVIKGIHCDHKVKFGDLETVVEELNHEVKRAEFVVADATMDREEIARNFAIPIFGVISDQKSTGGKIMANEQYVQKQKPWKQTIGYGAVSIALYAAVFMNADTVMHSFARGGWYAALPIATVFVFSFIHGAFASHLWSLLGIEAVKKNALRQVERKVVQKRKPAQKRPRAYAYVNPFHRI
jgi:hypothetical protein